MRRSALLVIAVLASASLWAQRSDIYAPKKTSTATNTVVTAAPAVSVSSVPSISESAAPASRTIDVDEYNRRYSGSASSHNSGGYVDEDGVVHDTVYVDNGSYEEGYSDATDDFEYAIRMARFHSPALSVLSSRFYWDLVYNWIDPWFYDPWYRAPWYYDSWYINSWSYNTWYYASTWSPYGYSFSFGFGVWNPLMPGVSVLYYNYPYYYGGVRYSDVFVPNRKLNTSWDRKLTGSQDIRTRIADNSRNSERNAASRTAVTNRETSRTSATSNRSADTSTRENVNARSFSKSSGNAAGETRTATQRTTTRNMNATSSSRNMNATSATRNDNYRSSSVRSNTGTDYSRPSSTERRNISEGATSVGRGSNSSSRSSSSGRSGISSSSSSSRSSASGSSVSRNSASSSSSSSSRSSSSSSFSSPSRSSSSGSFGGSSSMGGGMSSGGMGGSMSGGGGSRSGSAGGSRR